MKARDFLKDILEGGIPAAVDGIRATNDPKPEQQAPSGTIQDRIAGVNFFGANGSGISPQILGITALIVGALAVVYLLRR